MFFGDWVFTHNGFLIMPTSCTTYALPVSGRHGNFEAQLPVIFRLIFLEGFSLLFVFVTVNIGQRALIKY